MFIVTVLSFPQQHKVMRKEVKHRTVFGEQNFSKSDFHFLTSGSESIVSESETFMIILD